MSKLWVENWFQFQFLENSFHSFDKKKKKKKKTKHAQREVHVFFTFLFIVECGQSSMLELEGSTNFNSQESEELRIDFTRRMLADLTQISSNL